MKSKVKELFRTSFTKGVAFALGIFATGLLAVTVTGTINTFKVDDVLSSVTMNENFASLKAAIESVPDCSDYSVKLRPSANQNLPNSAGHTDINFDTEVFDAQNMHDNSDPSKVTIQKAGMYLITGRVAFAANATGVRTVHINAAGVYVYNQIPASAAETMIDTTTIHRFAQGDV